MSSMPRCDAGQHTCHLIGIGVFIERIKRELIDIDAAIHQLKETACCAYILHNKMADAKYNLAIIGRQDLLHRCLAQQIGNKV